MGLDEIFQALEEESQRETEQIIERAKEQARGIIEEAEREVEKIKQEQIEKISISLRREQTRILGEARLANQKEIFKAKEEIISEVYAAVKEKISHLRDAPNYPTIFKALLEQAIGNLPLEQVKLDLYVDQKDVDLAKKILAKTKANLEVHPGFKCAGGVKVSVEGEKITIVNTIDLRLEKAIQNLQAELLNILFPGSKG